MKPIFIAILFLVSTHLFSQNKKPVDSLKLVFSKDILEFYADNSGCFHQESVEYTFIKDKKTGGRTVMFNKDGKLKQKKISAKNYAAFVSNFTLSYNKFKDPEKVKQTCTSTSEFTITNRHANPISFKNVTCEAEFNPEMLLLKFLK